MRTVEVIEERRRASKKRKLKAEKQDQGQDTLFPE